jgi:dihydrofolate reductase
MHAAAAFLSRSAIAMRPRFTLVVACTADGFIARAPGHAPHEWASPEEQALFLASVDAADWSVLGRGTAAAAPKPWRRRIVFSTAAPQPDWRLPSQLWVDPAGLTPDDLPALVAPVRPMREALILGGARVHDWFHAHGRIDAVTLTVEPVRFGSGVPLFTGQGGADPIRTLEDRGFAVTGSAPINADGAMLVRLRPGG